MCKMLQWFDTRSNDNDLFNRPTFLQCNQKKILHCKTNLFKKNLKKSNNNKGASLQMCNVKTQDTVNPNPTESHKILLQEM